MPSRSKVSARGATKGESNGHRRVNRYRRRISITLPPSVHDAAKAFGTAQTPALGFSRLVEHAIIRVLREPALDPLAK